MARKGYEMANNNPTSVVIETEPKFMYFYTVSYDGILVDGWDLEKSTEFLDNHITWNDVNEIRAFVRKVLDEKLTGTHDQFTIRRTKELIKIDRYGVKVHIRVLHEHPAIAQSLAYENAIRDAWNRYNTERETFISLAMNKIMRLLPRVY